MDPFPCRRTGHPRGSAAPRRLRRHAETLSALDGIGPGELRIDSLVARVADVPVREVILALNATVEGQTTAHYIIDRLEGTPAQVTRLAHGVPVGGELDYLDEGTLAAALSARTAMKTTP